MANSNFSDMFARKLFYRALRSLPTSGAEQLAPRPSPLLTHLSTFDQPAAPTLEENAYYDKYKAKLEKAKQSRPKEYVAALDNIYGEKPTEDSVDSTDVKGSSVLSRMQASSTTKPTATDSVSSPRQRKDLNSIVKLDLLQTKSAEEIGQIWTQHYSGHSGVVYASIPVEKYERLKAKGKECPLYIYPLPRECGYEFILGQCANDDWYFTPLIAYQTHGEYAPYCLAIHYYTELASSKGTVLMMGEISSDDLKSELATLLVHETQLMYGSDENFKLVKSMSESLDDFQHMAVIDACKKAALF